MHLCTWTSSQEQESNCQKHCEQTVFFLALPANIFRSRRFEDTSKLLSANKIWTSESSEMFFCLSIRTKLWAKEAEGWNTIWEVIFCGGYNICWPPDFWYVPSLLWTLNVIAIKLIMMHIIKNAQCFLWITSLWNFNLYLNEYSVNKKMYMLYDQHRTAVHYTEHIKLSFNLSEILRGQVFSR